MVAVEVVVGWMFLHENKGMKEQIQKKTIV